MITFGRVCRRPASSVWSFDHDGDAVVVGLIARREAVPREVAVSVNDRFAQRAAYASGDRSVFQFVAPVPRGRVAIAVWMHPAQLVDGAAVSLSRVDPDQPVLLTDVVVKSPGATTCESRAIPRGGARTVVMENGDSAGLLPGVAQGTELIRDEVNGHWLMAADVMGDVPSIITTRPKNPYDVPLVHVNVTYRPVSG